MTTLEIMQEHPELVMMGKEFYPRDELLDLVWQEAGKDEMFISEAVNGDKAVNDLLTHIAAPNNSVDHFDICIALTRVLQRHFRKYAAYLVEEQQAAFMEWYGTAADPDREHIIDDNAQRGADIIASMGGR